MVASPRRGLAVAPERREHTHEGQASEESRRTLAATTHAAYTPQVKKVRRPEDLKTTPSNEDSARLMTLAGAYIAACARRGWPAFRPANSHRGGRPEY